MLEIDSLLDQAEAVDEVGEASCPGCPGENAPLLEVFTGPGPKRGPRTLVPWGRWKGFPLAEGTLSRRPGVREPAAAYMLWEREWDEMGEATPEPQRGLPWPVEKVAEVGVLKSLGEAAR